MATYNHVQKRSLDQPRLRRRRDRDRKSQIAEKSARGHSAGGARAASRSRQFFRGAVCNTCRGCWNGSRCSDCDGSGRRY